MLEQLAFNVLVKNNARYHTACHLNTTSHPKQMARAVSGNWYPDNNVALDVLNISCLGYFKPLLFQVLSCPDAVAARALGLV